MAGLRSVLSVNLAVPIQRTAYLVMLKYLSSSAKVIACSAKLSKQSDCSYALAALLRSKSDCLLSEAEQLAEGEFSASAR